MTPMRSGLTLATLAVLVGGCYSYRVVPVEQAPVGETVRARVSPTEAARLRDVIGREDRLLEGQLLETADTSILVAVRTPSDATVRTHQRVALPRSGLVELEVRRFDRLKTAGIAAVFVAALTAVAVNQFNSSTPSGGEGKGGTNASRVLPIGVHLRIGK